MRRPGLSDALKERQTIIYYQTPVERACNILSQGDDIADQDLDTLCRLLREEDGWQVEFTNEPNKNTASFSTTNGKKISVFLKNSCQSLSLVYRRRGWFKNFLVNSNGGTFPMLVCSLS